MARYRGLGGSVRGRKPGNTPPPPIEVKVAKLNFTGLSQAYDWVTIDPAFGMRLALKWYEENAPILLATNPLDAIGQKTYERAVKAQKLGEGTTIPDERKQAFTTALHLFEKLWSAKQPSIPLVDSALAPDAKPSKFLAWQRTLLEAFKVFEPFGLTYIPSTETTRSVLTVGSVSNSNKLTICIPVTELSQMRGSVLSVLLEEAVEAAKQTSVVEVAGVPQLDGNAFLATLPVILKAVADTAGGKSTVAPAMPKGAKVKVGGTTSEAAVSGQRTRQVLYLNHQVVNILRQGNPCKAGSIQASRFALLKSGMTVGEYRKAQAAAGFNTGLSSLVIGVSKGFVEVV